MPYEQNVTFGDRVDVSECNVLCIGCKEVHHERSTMQIGKRAIVLGGGVRHKNGQHKYVYTLQCGVYT